MEKWRGACPQPLQLTLCNQTSISYCLSVCVTGFLWITETNSQQGSLFDTNPNNSLLSGNPSKSPYFCIAGSPKMGSLMTPGHFAPENGWERKTIPLPIGAKACKSLLFLRAFAVSFRDGKLGKFFFSNLLHPKTNAVGISITHILLPLGDNLSIVAGMVCKEYNFRMTSVKPY